MSTGDIEDAGGVHGLCVKCPRHRKKMNGGLNVRVSDGLAWCQQPAVGVSVPPEDAPEPWRLPVYAVRVEGGLVFVSERPTGPCLVPVTSDEYGRREGRAEAPPPADASGAGVTQEPEAKECVSM